MASAISLSVCVRNHMKLSRLSNQNTMACGRCSRTTTSDKKSNILITTTIFLQTPPNTTFFPYKIQPWCVSPTFKWHMSNQKPDCQRNRQHEKKKKKTRTKGQKQQPNGKSNRCLAEIEWGCIASWSHRHTRTQPYQHHHDAYYTKTQQQYEKKKRVRIRHFYNMRHSALFAVLYSFSSCSPQFCCLVLPLNTVHTVCRILLVGVTCLCEFQSTEHVLTRQTCYSIYPNCWCLCCRLALRDTGTIKSRRVLYGSRYVIDSLRVCEKDRFQISDRININTSNNVRKFLEHTAPSERNK